MISMVMLEYLVFFAVTSIFLDVEIIVLASYVL